MMTWQIWKARINRREDVQRKFLMPGDVMKLPNFVYDYYSAMFNL